MATFNFGKPGDKAKAEQSKSIENVQSQLDNKANAGGPVKASDIPAVNPVDSPAVNPVQDFKRPDAATLSQNPNTAPDDLHFDGTSNPNPEAAKSNQLEPMSRTGPQPMLSPDGSNQLFQLTPDELDLINRNRKASGRPEISGDAQVVPPMGNPRIPGGSDIFSPASQPSTMRLDGTTKEVQPGKTTGVFAKLELTGSDDKDFIEAAEPFEGQKRKEGEYKYSVRLVNQPEAFVFAKDRLEAQFRYAKRLGIIATIHPYTVQQVNE